MAEGSPSRIPTPLSSLRRSASVRVRGERPLILYSTSPTPFPSISEREEACHLTKNYWTPTRQKLGQRSQVTKLDNDPRCVIITCGVSVSIQRTQQTRWWFGLGGEFCQQYKPNINSVELWALTVCQKWNHVFSTDSQIYSPLLGPWQHSWRIFDTNPKGKSQCPEAKGISLGALH